MGIFNKLRVWYDCKTSNRTEEYKAYKKNVERLESEIAMYQKTLNNAIANFTSAKQKFSEDSKEYQDMKNEVYKWKQTLEDRQLQLEFVRPNTQQDIDYRNKQYEDFPDELKAVLSPDFDLRFHGTSIYYAKQIIKSKTISSSADRYDGYIKSTDRKGEISVSNRETIGTTIHGWFTDLAAYRRSLPAGCIFALLPKDKEDAEYGENLIHSVDFTRNPEQLFGIFTTPENIEQVKKWMKSEKFNPELVYTFEEFIEVVKEKSKEIDSENEFKKRIINPIDNAKVSENLRNATKDESYLNNELHEEEQGLE